MSNIIDKGATIRENNRKALSLRVRRVYFFVGRTFHVNIRSRSSPYPT